jgi:hypothetical protein
MHSSKTASSFAHLVWAEEYTVAANAESEAVKATTDTAAAYSYSCAALTKSDHDHRKKYWSHAK